MGKIIARYSNPQSLTNIEYGAYELYSDQQKVLSQQVQQDDYLQPYSFEEWVKRNIGIVYGEEYKQYNKYLKSWYDARMVSTSATNAMLKNDYIALLQQLTLAFKDSVDEKVVSNINWNSELDIEEAIPYYARKLKEIAIYLVNKRDAIRKAKLKYNMSGARNALERLFYEYLLKAFTKRKYVLNVPEQSAWSAFPDLSAVNMQFQIMIEELYDDTSYFDKDPSMPLSSYFDITNPIVTTYYDSLDFPVSGLEWLFNTGIMPLCANNPLLWAITDTLCAYNVSSIDLLPASAFESLDSQILNEYSLFAITQKYLGENKYIISGGYYIPWIIDVSYNIQQGNNWFYWPSGEYEQEATLTDVDPIMLSATNLSISGATAGLTYTEADRVFTQIGDTIAGAWLKLTKEDTTTQSMSCKMVDNSYTRFKFPFPGFGVSGEDIEWSNKQISNINDPYNYLPSDIQEEVRKAYWTTVVTDSAINSVDINQTTLIDSGAIPSLNFNDADQVIIRDATNIDNIHDNSPDTLYKDLFEYAWLYEFQKTDIPIKIGQNRIYWPLTRYENFETLGYVIPSSQCASFSLSNVNATTDIIGARAGYGLSDSDIIYKLDTPNGDNAVECAWLSGQN